LPLQLAVGPDIKLSIPTASTGEVHETAPGQYEIQNRTESADSITAEVAGLIFVYEPGDVGVPVTIDIKPGNSDNTINLKSKGTVPVGILSTDTFDATRIDPSSATLASAPVKLKGKGTPIFSIKDLNDDGIDDMQVNIETSALDVSAVHIGAIFKAVTIDGIAVMGSDVVRVVNE